MSRKARNQAAERLQEPARLFAALGDSTRLQLVSQLAKGRAQSIRALTEGSPLTRQAITKHLRVLEDVGLVGSMKAGRESLYEFKPKAASEMRQYLDFVSAQWDVTLARLKTYVEEES